MGQEGKEWDYKVKEMALKRPEEKHWNWKTPKEPYPQLPGANMCFLAPSGMGKTTTLISILLGPMAKCFEEVHVFSPSCEIDSAWDPVREFVKGLKASSFHTDWDEKALSDIMENQKAKIKELKAQYSELERKLAEVKADGDTEAKGSNAGNAFGGRASMAKKPD